MTQLSLAHSHFIENHAVEGGALCVKLESKAIISGFHFKLNTASQQGGAVFVRMVYVALAIEAVEGVERAIALALGATVGA